MEANHNVSLVDKLQSDAGQYISIVDGPDGVRLFHLGDSQPQSAMYPERPLETVYSYISTFFVGLLWHPNPKRVLLVGLGGGTFPRIFRHYFPNTHIDIVEYDRGVLLMAKKHMQFEEDSLMKVFISDGRQFVQDRAHDGTKYDIVYCDAFSEKDGLPVHMRGKAFQQELKAILSDDNGVLVSNIVASVSGATIHERINIFKSMHELNYYFASHIKRFNVVLVSGNLNIKRTKEQIVHMAQQLQIQHQFQSFDLVKTVNCFHEV
ncbi:unnamed protein product [Adineta steineri]|uniref:PABS domain-containing protein n=1 Tax=Adineta steineri TaxID=433720 RepID=A0A815AXC4_9BILA|nr:unnamed protein product [Adineta steineri]CAF3899468.1 unnamed protein product [Adineta steineri]